MPLGHCISQYEFFMDTDGYQQIASINIHHSYFADGFCRGIVFEPDKPTNLLLKKLGFLFGSSKSGFALYADAAHLSVDRQGIEKEKGVWNSLRFVMAFQDPNFFRFTHLPNISGENILYGLSAHADLPTSRVARLLVNFSSENDHPLKSELVIELTELLQRLSEKGNAVYDFYLTAKSTQWVYVLLNKEWLSLTHLKITNQAFTFLGPHLVVLPNGDNAFLFSSGTHHIPFAEVPTTFCSLIDDASGPAKHRTIISRLPIADPGKLSRFTGIDGVDADASFIYIN